MLTHKIDVFVDEAWNRRQVSSCGPTLTIDGCADDTCPLSQTLDLVFDIFWPSEIQFCSFKGSIKNKLQKGAGQHEAAVVVEENQITLYLCPNWWQEPKEHRCNMINDELIL